MITCKRGRAKTKYMPRTKSVALISTSAPSSPTPPVVAQAPAPIVRAPIAHRWDLINLFIERRNYARYLEVGSPSVECFGKVSARVKARIEASEISSLWFRNFRARAETFDLIFVDRDDDVTAFRDLTFALECLAPGGCVMVSNCLSSDPSKTTWRAFTMFREQDELDAIVAEIDDGVGLLRRIPNPIPIEIGKPMHELTESDRTVNRDMWLRPQPIFVLERIAEFPWGKPTVAIMVIGKSEEEIEWFKQNSPRANEEARMVYVANPGRRYGATAVIANPFLETATEDVVAVVHADTSFAPGAIGVFAQVAIDNDCLTGIVGRAKAHPGAANMGYTWCTSDGGYVSTLDSCSVFFRRNLGLRFDGRTFDDFHCVVEDLCLQARLRGIRSFVPKAEAGHIGTATEPTWNHNFWRYRKCLLDKYPDEEIHTV